MTDALRRLVAYVAGVVVEGYQPDGIFDFESGTRFPVSGTIEGNRIDLLDETDGARLSGTLPNLVTGTGAPVALNIAGDAFDGHDETSGTPFKGEVSGRNIDLFVGRRKDGYTYCL